MSFDAQVMTFIQKCYFQLRKSIIWLFLANFSKMADFRKIPNNMNIIDTDVIWCTTDDCYSEMPQNNATSSFSANPLTLCMCYRYAQNDNKRNPDDNLLTPRHIPT